MIETRPRYTPTPPSDSNNTRIVSTEWAIENLTKRVNSDINGTQVFEIADNASNPTSFLSLRVVSTSESENYPTAELLFNALEGLNVEQENTNFIASAAGVYCKYGAYIFQLNSSGYVVSDPSAFRAAIGIQETFGEYLAAIASTTSDPGIENKPWNDNGTFKFSTGSFSTYFRPDGFSQIFRPDGVSLYLRP